MPAAEAVRTPQPLSVAETNGLFADLVSARAIVLAVSGGPDSTALLFLAARWRKARRRGPELLAVTVDHGLRKEAAAEAQQVARLARKLGVPHRILRWSGAKPKSGLQEKARMARYRLLAEAAAKAGASHILTAHTLDDQAETVLMRLLRGSGPAGLAGMARETRLAELTLTRPLLDIPKARLLATLRKARIPFSDDPSNRDPRFTRVRMRGLLPRLVEEGLDARRLAVLARRLRRAESALEATVEAAAKLARGDWASGGRSEMAARHFAALPAEVALRLLARAVTMAGHEGPVELAKLEALHAAMMAKKPKDGRFRRTLAGAMVTLTPEWLTVEGAPPRRMP
ncbi:MAG TPA: tRNA lysidine(34) synthetase TilS [Xanthobacteraceae bacterium]|nr:tRNA lysidine(34) synthetase TilS [Xanthobacteraceae bacterium]